MSVISKKPPLKASRRQWFASYVFYTALFVCAFIIAVKLILNDKVSGMALYAVVFMPALPLLGVAFGFRRLLRSGDEMQTRVLVSALLKGLAAMLLIIVPWGFMNVMVSTLPTLSAYALLFVFLMTFLLSLIWGHWKLGVFSKTKDYNSWREPKA